MCKPIMKQGRCIAGTLEPSDLKRCAGCEVEFIKDLRRARFEGVIIRSTGKKEQLRPGRA